MFTINGIGITLIDGIIGVKKDADGSYIANKWFTFIFLPVIPLGSYRVFSKREGTNLILYTSDKLYMQKIEFQWKLVFKTYIVCYGGLALILLLCGLIFSIGS